MAGTKRIEFNKAGKTAAGILIGPTIGGLVGTPVIIVVVLVYEQLFPASGAAEFSFVEVGVMTAVSSIFGAIVGLIYLFGPNVFFGLPLYYALRKLELTSLFAFILAGAVIGGVAIAMAPELSGAEKMFEQLWWIGLVSAVFGWMFLWRIRRPDLD